jgi:hypothetical protein
MFNLNMKTSVWIAMLVLTINLSGQTDSVKVPRIGLVLSGGAAKGSYRGT